MRSCSYNDLNGSGAPLYRVPWVKDSQRVVGLYASDIHCSRPEQIYAASQGVAQTTGVPRILMATFTEH
jgi:hypothetical protein